MSRALGIAITCAPFISALLLAIHRGGRALTNRHRKDRPVTQLDTLIPPAEPEGHP